MAITNVFLTLNFPIAGAGTATDVSGIAADKTLVVTGPFNGDVIIEGSQDGTNFVPLDQASPPLGQPVQITVTEAVSHLRIRRLGAGTPGVVTVAGVASTTNLFATLTVVPSGTGPAVDTSAFGPIQTYLTGGGFSGQIIFEGTEDDTTFNVITALGSSQSATIVGTYKKIRVRALPESGAPAFVGTAFATVGAAINGGGGGSSGTGNALLKFSAKETAGAFLYVGPLYLRDTFDTTLAVVAPANYPMPACEVSFLGVKANTANAVPIFCTVYKNGVPTAVTTTIPAGSLAVFFDIINTVTFALGDVLDVVVDPMGGIASVVDFSATLQVKVT